MQDNGFEYGISEMIIRFDNEKIPTRALKFKIDNIEKVINFNELNYLYKFSGVGIIKDLMNLINGCCVVTNEDYDKYFEFTNQK